VFSSDRVLVSYPKDVLERLHEQTQEAESVRRFIEIESNQMFLRKMKQYLEDEIRRRYQGSEIQKLIADLRDVEDRMAASGMPVIANLPPGLRHTIGQLEKVKEQIDVLKQLVMAVPIPFFPRNFIIRMIDFSYLTYRLTKKSQRATP
jgi:DNA repair exonuclease SbcCD ATPase subunit